MGGGNFAFYCTRRLTIFSLSRTREQTEPIVVLPHCEVDLEKLSVAKSSVGRSVGDTLTGNTMPKTCGNPSRPRNDSLEFQIAICRAYSSDGSAALQFICPTEFFRNHATAVDITTDRHRPVRGHTGEYKRGQS